MFFDLKTAAWFILLIIQVISYGSFSVLVHLCEIDGSIPFESTSMNLLIEIAKLLIAYACFFFQNISCSKNDSEKNQMNLKFLDQNTSKGFNLRNSFSFIIPAGLYFISNNLAVCIQLYMDSTSYQILSNFKILTTAALYYLMIGKKIDSLKTFSLIILFFSSILYSMGNFKSNDISNSKNIIGKSDMLNITANLFEKDHFYITQTGVILILAYCTISGFAGVYNEYLLKLNFKESINMQNIYLYFYGCLFNLAANLLRFKLIISETKENWYSLIVFFFNGFSIFTWTIIGTQAFNGIAMSIVIKHASNIIRLFVISCSMFITTLLSVYIFKLHLNLYFYTSFFATIFAIYLYSR
jgi:probable UDP-sugar transporter A4